MPRKRRRVSCDEDFEEAGVTGLSIEHPLAVLVCERFFIAQYGYRWNISRYNRNISN